MNQSDIQLYKSKVINDTSQNGGREGYSAVVSGVMNNVFPVVSSSERTAGGQRYRKVFFHNKNASEEIAYNCKAFLKDISSSEDHYALIAGTHTDTQAEIGGSPKYYATGTLAVAASAGGTQIQVDFENKDHVSLSNGDGLWLYGTNGEMFNTVSGTPTWVGNRATINLGSQLNVDYPINSICAMTITTSELKPSYDSFQVNSSGGTYNSSSYPPLLYNWGTVRDDWTITITGSLGGGVMSFSCSGVYEGSVGTGRTDQDFQPSNPNTSSLFFKLRAAGWGGTWQVGDTLVFKTYPSSLGIWVVEFWPAGASPGQSLVHLDLYCE